VNAQDSKAEIFDVFLCHNSQDKPAVREIEQKLTEENCKPWLDEADISGGSFWQQAIGRQVESQGVAQEFQRSVFMLSDIHQRPASTAMRRWNRLQSG
jgi:TIR domain